MRPYQNLISVFLLFSATVLIINNLRPHHHHHQHICYVADHCEGEEGDRHHHDGTAHDGFDHSHSHPIHGECKVNTVFIIPFIQKVNGKLICDSQKKVFLHYNALAEGNNELSTLAVSYHIFLTNKQSGRALKILILSLRAPPVC